MTESQIQKQIIDYIRLLNGLVFRMNAGSTKHNVKLAPKGTPDLFTVTPFGAYWIEVKTATGKLRKSQVAMIKKLRDMGQIVIVARSLEDVKGEINDTKKTT